MNPQTKQKLLSFLDERMFGVISSVNENSKPESAFVAYSANNRLEVIVGTSKLSRKVKNITSNSSVAFVIADLKGEIQYEGQATIIDRQAYDQLVQSGDATHLPGTDKYRQDPNQVWLRVKPTWIRFILHGDPDHVEEFSEFS